jgi:5'(3')-deoxyribonucleotidase
MDETLCHYKAAYNKAKKKDSSVRYPQSRPGFFRSLKPIDGAINSVNALRKVGDYEVYILTRPSVKNPFCYMEKRLWIEDHFDIKLAENLIISAHKNLCIGDYLIDDMLTGAGQNKFQGQVIQFGSERFPNWEAVLSFFNLSL